MHSRLALLVHKCSTWFLFTTWERIICRVTVPLKIRPCNESALFQDWLGNKVICWLERFQPSVRERTNLIWSTLRLIVNDVNRAMWPWKIASYWQTKPWMDHLLSIENGWPFKVTDRVPLPVVEFGRVELLYSEANTVAKKIAISKLHLLSHAGDKNHCTLHPYYHCLFLRLLQSEVFGLLHHPTRHPAYIS